MHISPVSIYRKMFSERTRMCLYELFLEKVLTYIRLNKREKRKWWKKKCFFWFHRPSSELEIAWKEWSMKMVSHCPYKWEKVYQKVYTVSIDEYNGLCYVMHKGKRLYFKRGLTKIFVGLLYKSLLIEQDRRSAHCYVDNIAELQGKILFDVGAAEGIFTLDSIDYVERAFLFECDEGWIEALEATFAPYKQKIQIIRGYVSDKIFEGNITLDSFFHEYTRNLNDIAINQIFMKMDIEGAERDALKGARHLFNQVNVAGAICIYHLADDEQVIKKILQDRNLSIYVVPSYFYFGGEMRHAIIRFWKQKDTEEKAGCA